MKSKRDKDSYCILYTNGNVYKEAIGQNTKKCFTKIKTNGIVCLAMGKQCPEKDVLFFVPRLRGTTFPLALTAYADFSKNI